MVLGTSSCIISVWFTVRKYRSKKGFIGLYMILIIKTQYLINSGPGSSVRIATGYELDGPGIEYLWRRGLDRLWAHTAPCTMGTGAFPGVVSGPGVLLTPHPF
jgi:hypothetical protein